MPVLCVFSLAFFAKFAQLGELFQCIRLLPFTGDFIGLINREPQPIVAMVAEHRIAGREHLFAVAPFPLSLDEVNLSD